ncbi:MAG: flavin reductase [Chloroflexi bacterium]|nr:flavin reductase [Chloroflexota bacterium]
MVVATAVDRDLSRVMEQLAYGCYIVGSQDADGEPNGMMADWVMQVSFVPRMLAVAFENDAHTLANIRANGAFTLNLLPRDDDGLRLAARFAQPHNGAKVGGRGNSGHERIHHKLETVPHELAANGAPVLTGACAWLECEAVDFVPTGDHVVVTARILHGRLVTVSDILTSEFTGWSYAG